MQYSIKLNAVNNPEKSVKAFATVTFGDCFKVTNIAVVEGKETRLSSPCLLLSQAMVNQLFAGSLAMMGQVQKPLQVEQPQQSLSPISVSEAGCCTTEENLGTEFRELEADNHNSMDMDTRSALGSLFDDED